MDCIIPVAPHDDLHIPIRPAKNNAKTIFKFIGQNVYFKFKNLKIPPFTLKRRRHERRTRIGIPPVLVL